jgi:nicotinamidase-related amidase
MAMLDPRNTTLLVIDLQEKLLPAIWERDRVVANVTKLLRLARILGLKTVPTTQYCRGLGPTVPEIAGLLERQPIDKTSFGCFGDPRITAELNGTLLVAGIEAHICVCQTVLGALEAGFAVHVAADATSSRCAANMQVGVERMRSAGAVISSTEMAIYELLGRSDREEFRQMLPYLK